jgi:hypothetical protein
VVFGREDALVSSVDVEDRVELDPVVVWIELEGRDVDIDVLLLSVVLELC